MSLIWQGDQFAWEFITAVVLAVFILLSCDYAWRTTRLTGRGILLLGGAGMFIGLVLIYLPGRL
jgi:hypothetical protein